MKVEWNEQNDGIFPVTLELEKDVDLVIKEKAKELARACPEDKAEMRQHLRVGGTWYYNLEELHKFVQQGAVLHGLPEWLIIK